MKRWRQEELRFRMRGGFRRGAGRKKQVGSRAKVPHRARPAHQKHQPVHVTLRASNRLTSLRKQIVFNTVRRAIAKTARSWFRIVHYSVQVDHVHLLVEANDRSSLSRGLMGTAIRLSRAVNAVLHRRGHVWSDRYHARALRTPREVRIGLVYVLMNWKKHLPSATDFDPRSSAWSFDGWKVPPSVGPPEALSTRLVERPATWLLRTGWKRHGLILSSEGPFGAL
jgi:REP element-mobilizing transposase RayT